MKIQYWLRKKLKFGQKTKICLNCDMKNITPKQAGKELTKILAKLRAGADYYECETEAQPFINIINKRSIELGKKFGVKAKKISFAYVAR